MSIIETFKPRLDTAIQTAAANRHQDRYVMITFRHLTDSKSRSSSLTVDPPRRRSCKISRFAIVNVAIDLHCANGRHLRSATD